MTAIFDRCVQAVYAIGLEPWSEHTADKNSYGFRRGRSPSWAMKYLEILLRGRADPSWVLEVDIEKCFDRINHDWMIQNIPVVPKPVMVSWLKQGYIIRDFEQYGIFPTKSGIPQGGIISPMICNLSLNGIEQHLMDVQTKYVRLTSKGAKAWHACRFADDMVVLTRSEEMCQNAAKELNDFLAPRGMNLSAQKTKITSLRGDYSFFDFVGYRFERCFYHSINKAKWFVVPPIHKRSALVEKLDVLSKDTSVSVEGYFIKTNQIVRGWVNYYITTNARRTLRWLGQYLWIKFYWGLYRRLKRTAAAKALKGGRRRISRKRMSSYISNTYQARWYYRSGRHSIKWYVLKNPKALRTTNYALFAPQIIRINNSVPVSKSGLNACIPSDWERIVKINLNYRTGLRKDVIVKYDGKCALCQIGLLFTNIRYEIHHILPIKFGGRNTITNMCPLCKGCHTNVSSAVASGDVNRCGELVARGVLHEDVLNIIQQ